MMVALLVYAYCTGVYSSRRIERACHEDVAFRVITGNAQPYFTTVNEFRRVHREQFGALFVQVLKLCREAGLVALRHVAIDGTKVKAMSYKRMLREERRLQAEVERLLSEADAADASEDARYGASARGDEVPEELRRRESRLERIREAKAALEAEAGKTRARTLREQAERNEHTAQTHPEEVVRRRARAPMRRIAARRPRSSTRATTTRRAGPAPMGSWRENPPWRRPRASPLTRRSATSPTPTAPS